ncbi:porin [Methylobacterium sp. EM32]|uniref:porin n=1 Tax=Methylobacterium sp. EM32 TaxID=3163481 RepID=UPI0033B51D0A
MRGGWRLLGSVAGLAALHGAGHGVLAADLPGRQAAPIVYVRVCTAHGTGFFFIPGTDTCLRVSGRAQVQTGYVQSYARSGVNGDLTNFWAAGRLNLDARTQTAYGTLRAFVRFDLISRTGNYVTSGSQQRLGRAFPALGVDTFGRGQTYVNVDKAFIQFAGLTAGRAASFYDFYAHDFEIVGASLGSDLFSTNLIAYTAKVGEGFQATLSIEDPIHRKNPVFGNGVAGNTASQFQVFFPGSGNFAPLVVTDAAGVPVGEAFYDAAQRSRLPDIVGVLRYDASWGSLQASAALHEITIGNASSLTRFSGAPASAAATPRPAAAYGFAVQGGAKVNLPMIAAGDALYLQGAYGEGATLYTGYANYTASYTATASLGQGTAVPQDFVDAVLDPVTGRLDRSTSWTILASYLHNWNPNWRSAFFGSYGEIAFGKAARTGLGLLTFAGIPNPALRPAAFALSGTLRDTNQLVTGLNLIWSPVRDLDIGLEGLYSRVGLQSGRTIDLGRYPGAVVADVVDGVPVTAAGAPLRTVSSTDVFQFRMRVQREF